MTLLELRQAAWEHGGQSAGPFSLSLAENERLAVTARDAVAARALAMLAAGIVRASSGTVYVGAFDARVQPVHAKRLAGYVPHEAVSSGFPSFERYIEFRADLWGVPRAVAVVRAKAVLEQLQGMHEAFAFPLAGALCAAPRLLVLDRPQPAHAALVGAVANCAVLSTHTSEEDAAAFRSDTVFA